MPEPVKIDLIFLSYAKDEELKQLTVNAIQSLMDSEDSSVIQFNILVIESNKLMEPFQFDHTKTIYPVEEFGFHKYLNMGIRATQNKYVCLCNNDLIFHKGWATNILNEMSLDPELASACPYCPYSHQTNGIADDGKIHYSTEPGMLIGWCIFFKREILNSIGYLDEKIKFWYSDNDYGKSLAKHQIKHALITASKVTHLGSKSIKTFTQEQLFDFCYAQFAYFDFKWNHRNKLILKTKNLLLPVFYYFLINRSKNSFFDMAARAMSKLYGGLKI